MKIEKCPFCGGEAETKMYLWGEHAETHAPIWCYYAFCRACDAMTDNVFKTEEEAIAAWNRRAGKDINVATNADRIRGATDEKLANVISAALGKMSYGCYRCPAKDFCHSGECEQAWLDWLQQPAKPERSEG